MDSSDPGLPKASGAPHAALPSRYVVRREIGSGGMSTVYLADDRELGSQVAVKVLRADLTPALGPTRFQREIEILSRLRHPNIVPLLDSYLSGTLVYFVMPYVAGGSLQGLLDRQGSLTLGRTIEIMKDVAAAVDYAHAQNVVHRDIKPSNILLDEGRALVCDFGVARAIAQAAGSWSSSGVVVGTPAYMSPEQATGSSTIESASDVYSLGCVLYVMLTGELPFTGPTTQAIIARHVAERARPLRTVRPDVPKYVEEAVLAALAKSPHERPRTLTALVRALEGP